MTRTTGRSLAQTMKLVAGDSSSRIGRSIAKRSISPADGVVPSTTSSARIAAQDRGELVGVRGAEGDEDARARPAGGRRRSRDPGSACRGRSSCRSPGRACPGRWRGQEVATGGAKPTSSRSNVRVAGVDLVAADVLGGLRAGLAVGREAVEATARPSRSRSGSGPGANAAGSGQAKYVTCSLVIVSGSRRSKSRSRSFVQASAARTTVAARWTVPSASLDLDPAAGVAQPRHRGAVEERRAVRRGRAAGGRRCRGSGRRGRTSAWKRPWCSSPRRHCGQRRMISARVEVLVRDALGVHRGRVVAPAGSRRRAARRRGRRSPSRSSRRPRLDLGPRRVGAPREPDVVGPVVGEADDPAVVLAGAVEVAQLELLESQDPVAKPLGSASRPRPSRSPPSPTTIASHSSARTGSYDARRQVVGGRLRVACRPSCSEPDSCVAGRVRRTTLTCASARG